MLDLYAWTVLASTLALGAWVLPRMARLPRLRPAATDGSGAPRTAVVVAARDEAESIESAVRALSAAATDFGRDALRVIVVDDRSRDGTGALLDRLAAELSTVEVIHVEALPPGWLGKNHALHVGAGAAGDVEWLVFTDADVVFEPGGLRAAVEATRARDLDHLTGAPRVVARGLPLQAMIATFGVLFGLFTRPWAASDERSRASVGIGALNVVRRTAYERAGGHAALRLFVDDDLRLGRLLKESGARSAFVFARDIASVAWYPSLRAMARGLVKNVFAGIDYRLSLAVGATIALGLGCVVPAVLAVAPGTDMHVRVPLAAAALAQIVGAMDSARRAGLPTHAGALYPLAVAFFLGVLWRSTLTALITRRVTWRETSYSLAELVAFNRQST